jgi:hypothetical protein
MGPPMLTPIVGSVLAPPMPVAAATDGKTHLAYELVLTNASAQDVTVWLDVALAGAVDAASTPTDLIHTVTVSIPLPQPPPAPSVGPAVMTETVAPTTVDHRTPVTISPPLSGDNWVDANGCCDATPHRMAVNPLSGALWAPERYAIDSVRLTPDGRLFNGDKRDLAGYPSFGADVIAVADGPVVAVTDGLPEQIPGASPVGLPLDEYAGNRVIQDIGGGGRFATPATATRRTCTFS